MRYSTGPPRQVIEAVLTSIGKFVCSTLFILLFLYIMGCAKELSTYNSSIFHEVKPKEYRVIGVPVRVISDWVPTPLLL